MATYYEKRAINRIQQLGGNDRDLIRFDHMTKKQWEQIRAVLHRRNSPDNTFGFGDTPLEAQELSIWLVRRLQTYGFRHVKDLTLFSQDELHELKGLGGKALTQIKRLLQAAELDLADPDVAYDVRLTKLYGSVKSTPARMLVAMASVKKGRIVHGNRSSYYVDPEGFKEFIQSRINTTIGDVITRPIRDYTEKAPERPSIWVTRAERALVTTLNDLGLRLTE